MKTNAELATEILLALINQQWIPITPTPTESALKVFETLLMGLNTLNPPVPVEKH